MGNPRSVGRYEILGAVGSGGMGTVYQAFDPTLERVVALKVVQLDGVHDESPERTRERFRNEARAVARLNHPAIVTIFDYDDDDASAYIAMEYVQGCALDEYVRQRPELQLEDAVSAMQQVLGGLAYAHARDVVHRDIKPSNLLVTREGLVKITDFGTARIGPRVTTQTGLLVGTPQYMAPEQYIGGKVDHCCDIHAAAAVLYELLTGSAPFAGTPAEIMYKVCHQVPQPMSSLNPSIPKVFDHIVAKCLQKRPADRYGSALEFQQALGAGWQAFSPRPPSPTLSQSARLIATAIYRRSSAASRAITPGPAPAPHLREPVPGAGPLAAPEAPASPTPSRSPSQPGSLLAWSREQLAEIEQQLLPLVGPMARILVRDAAATTANRQQLYQLLASHLHSAEERRQFLLFGERPATGAGATAATASPGTAAQAGFGTDQPVTPEVVQRAGQLLARYIGPIATPMTRRAAQAATDETQFYVLLAEKIADGAERERFLREALRRR